MAENLTIRELIDLLNGVFEPRDDERKIAILLDLPDRIVPDLPAWRERREMALDWARTLAGQGDGAFDVQMYLYRNARMNNADLPTRAWLHDLGGLPDSADELDPEMAIDFVEIFQRYPLFVVPSQFSATAPMKLSAKNFGFRGVTMPGFAASMIPALRLDYVDINRRVSLLADMLDVAVGADIEFLVDGSLTYSLHLDLHNRTAHRSGGRFPLPGTVGNLPSGEAYIVPYEGETGPSASQGDMPVQFCDEVVVYKIVGNHAVAVVSKGPEADRERALLVAEPAYGNLAELGLGVLADFGIKVQGEVLIDEKLGLHIAFGRSDHFGGQVGAKDFTRPEAVVHIDRVYLPEICPRIAVVSVDLDQADGTRVPLMRDGAYVVKF